MMYNVHTKNAASDTMCMKGNDSRWVCFNLGVSHTAFMLVTVKHQCVYWVWTASVVADSAFAGCRLRRSRPSDHVFS